MRKELFAPMAALCCLVLLAGCDSSGGEGGTTPEEGEARIVESFTCRDVEGSGRPVGITEIFSQYHDDRIYVWISWENVEGEHVAEAIWYDPGGSKEYESAEEFDSSNGEQITWFYVEPASMDLGRWEVEIWLDDVFHRSHFFVVEE